MRIWPWRFVPPYQEFLACYVKNVESCFSLFARVTSSKTLLTPFVCNFHNLRIRCWVQQSMQFRSHEIQRTEEPDSSVGRASKRKVRRNSDTGSIPRCGKGFFSAPESTFSADSLTVSVQPPCTTACVNSCTHVKNPTHWQPYRRCLDTWKHFTHWKKWVALLLRLL